jgi:hypothetical protein
MRGLARRISWPAARRRAVQLLAASLVAAAGMVIGWQLAGPTEVETGLGRASFEVTPDAWGGVDAYVPLADWGLRTNAFTGPFRLEFEIRSIDRRGALGAAGGEGGALADIEGELEAELSQLLAFLERQRDNDRYSTTFEGALVNFSAYLSEAPRAGDEPGRTVLFGSDVHNNALVLPALGRFSDGEPVLLAGDFGHQGNEAEARLIAPRIATLSDEVLAVSGNHDSAGLVQALAEEGVTVLGTDGQLGPDGEYSGEALAPIGNLTVAGFPDPLEWQGDDPDAPDRTFSFPELDDGDALEEQAKAELVTWFQLKAHQGLGRQAHEDHVRHERCVAERAVGDVAGRTANRGRAGQLGFPYPPGGQQRLRVIPLRCLFEWDEMSPCV